MNVGNLENIQQNGDSAMENWRGIKDKGLLQVESNKQTIKPFVKLHWHLHFRCLLKCFSPCQVASMEGQGWPESNAHTFSWPRKTIAAASVPRATKAGAASLIHKANFSFRWRSVSQNSCRKISSYFIVVLAWFLFSTNILKWIPQKFVPLHLSIFTTPNSFFTTKSGHQQPTKTTTSR